MNCGLCKTNPIRPLEYGGRARPPHKEPSGTKRAKRTQLPEARHRRGVRLRRPGRGSGDEGQRRQTNPIWRWCRGGGAGGCQRPPGHDGAKQSQFPAEQEEGQRLGGKGVMVNSTFDRPRQNKAKLGQDGTSGGTALQGGQSCETKPISPGGIAEGTVERKPPDGENETRRSAVG